MIQLVKGFKDILPDETELWQYIELTARDLFEDFGFKEIRLPILEQTELFSRSIGEETDIVGKEMYTFADGKRGSVTLRPEATASVVRSYIQHKMYAADPVRKLYTIGPMFRRERPQKGRFRQFYQINAEIFGIEAPFIDAQLIYMLTLLLDRLKVKDVTVHVNSLGCPECRPTFHNALLDLLAAAKDNLCSDCQRRSTKNPLRVLDCKVPGCRDAMADAPAITDYLCGGCQDHFDTVRSLLDSQGVSYAVDKRLVRGLDYYSRTTFEVQTTHAGAQNAVAGGGRYDSLVKMLGGPSQPAIGFAVGFDRLIDIVGLNVRHFIKLPDLFIAAIGENSLKHAYEWSCALNCRGIRTETDFSGKSLKSLMKRANKLQAARVLIIGDDELGTGKATLRNMQTKEQVSVPTATLVESIIQNVTHAADEPPQAF